MTSVSAGQIILTPIQPVGSGRPQWGSKPGSPHQELRALLTELQLPQLEHQRYFVMSKKFLHVSIFFFTMASLETLYRQLEETLQ